VEYLKAPLDTTELRRLVKLLGVKPRELLRTGEAPYREVGLNDPDVTDQAILAAIANHPILLERPIAVAGKRAVIGRPPERVLELL
jgi:arsenate reductase